MEDIYSVLFDKIISGEYVAGTRLKQEDLAKEFKISRTPIRVVLLQLDQDGLVKFSPNKGVVVLPFTADEIEEIFEIRKTLELLCLEIAAPVLKIHKLLEIKAAMLHSYETNNIKELIELDARLHSYVLNTSGKKRLIIMLNHLFRLLQKFRSLGYLETDLRENAIREHFELIDTLCMRDTEKAKDLMKKHIENAKINALLHLFRTKK